MVGMSTTIDPHAPAFAHIEDFGQFVQASPSPFHAAEEVARRLEAAGFARHSESDPWDASPGGHVLVRGGAVMAWRVPEDAGPDAGFRVVGTHTDSPGLVLKPSPDASHAGYQQVNVEVYGGMLRTSWLDRELGIAGRLFLSDGTRVLVKTPPVMRIPQLAIHLDRKVNEGLVLDPQQHLHPIWAVGHPRGSILAYVAEQAGVEASQVVGFDLCAYDTQVPAGFGGADELYAAARMDNLLSVHAGVRAMLEPDTELDAWFGTDAASTPCIDVLACFNHEEIGSGSDEGAAGPLLDHVLERTGRALGADAEQLHQMYARSVVLSCDGAHAVHPNYTDRHDPDHQPVLNGGPVLKVNANQRYATTGGGAALWTRCCAAAGVQSQVIVSNNAMPCGSTIGPLTATRLGIRTIDVGVPMLSMHSAREMCGSLDPYALAQAIRAFWSGA